MAKSGKVEDPLAKMDAPAFTFMGVMLKRRDGAAFFKECFEQIGYALLAHPDAASPPQVAAMVQLALHTMATRLASASLHHFKQTSMLKEAAFYAKAKTNITPVVAAARAMCARTGAPWPRDERFAFMLRYESDAKLALQPHYNPKSKHKTNTDLAVDWERFRQLGEETSRAVEVAAASETLAALLRDDPEHVPKGRLQAAQAAVAEAERGVQPHLPKMLQGAKNRLLDLASLGLTNAEGMYERVVLNYANALEHRSGLTLVSSQFEEPPQQSRSFAPEGWGNSAEAFLNGWFAASQRQQQATEATAAECAPPLTGRENEELCLHANLAAPLALRREVPEGGSEPMPRLTDRMAPARCATAVDAARRLACTMHLTNLRAAVKGSDELMLPDEGSEALRSLAADALAIDRTKYASAPAVVGDPLWTERLYPKAHALLCRLRQTDAYRALCAPELAAATARHAKVARASWQQPDVYRQWEEELRRKSTTSQSLDNLLTDPEAYWRARSGQSKVVPAPAPTQQLLGTEEQLNTAETSVICRLLRMEQPCQCQAGLVRLKSFVSLFVSRKKRANGGSEVPPKRQMLALNQRNQLTGAIEATTKTAERCADAARQRDISAVAGSAQKELTKLDKELKRQSETTTSPSERCAHLTPVWGATARSRPRKQQRRGCAFIQTEASGSEGEEEDEEEDQGSADELDEDGNLADLVNDD